jgi:hypothetical protein
VYKTHCAVMDTFTRRRPSHHNVVQLSGPYKHISWNWRNKIRLQLILKNSQGRCIPQASRQRVLNSRGSETKTTLSEWFRVTFWNFEKFFVRWAERTRWFICTEWGRKIVRKRTFKMTAGQDSEWLYTGIGDDGKQLLAVCPDVRAKSCLAWRTLFTNGTYMR